MSASPAVEAVVLAGGRARRLGADKPRYVVGGRSLLDAAVDATCGVDAVVVVGPPDLAQPERFLLTQEDPPFGGPVAGVAAGVVALDAARGAGRPAPDWLLVLACDVPQAADLVPRLRAELPVDASAQAVLAVDSDRPQWLLGFYSRAAVDAVVGRLGPAVRAAPARLLADGLRLRLVADRGQSRDVDTPADGAALDRLLRRLPANRQAPSSRVPGRQVPHSGDERP